MEMRAVRQASAGFFRPFGLAWPQAHRAMAVSTGTGIPFAVLALAACRLVVTKFPVAAVRNQVERRILLFPESSGPQIAPFTQYIIDGRFDADILNTSPEPCKYNFHPRFVDCFIHSCISSNDEWWQRRGQGRNSPARAVAVATHALFALDLFSA